MFAVETAQASFIHFIAASPPWPASWRLTEWVRTTLSVSADNRPTIADNRLGGAWNVCVIYNLSLVSGLPLLSRPLFHRGLRQSGLTDSSRLRSLGRCLSRRPAGARSHSSRAGSDLRRFTIPPRREVGTSLTDHLGSLHLKHSIGVLLAHLVPNLKFHYTWTQTSVLKRWLQTTDP